MTPKPSPSPAQHDPVNEPPGRSFKRPQGIRLESGQNLMYKFNIRARARLYCLLHSFAFACLLTRRRTLPKPPLRSCVSGIEGTQSANQPTSQIPTVRLRVLSSSKQHLTDRPPANRRGVSARTERNVPHHSSNHTLLRPRPHRSSNHQMRKVTS